MRGLLGRYYLLYRAWYIFFSIISLIPILIYQYSLPQHLLFTWHGPWRIFQGALLGYAGILFYYGKEAYDMTYFLGIRGWNDFRSGSQPKPIPFRVDGILRYVRHPWYSGGIAFLWGVGSITNTMLSAKLLLTGYLIIGTILEEKKLLKEIGEPYRDYCRKVPMLLPWKRPTI